MTKQEAQEALRGGAKITHAYFTDNEWVRYLPTNNKLQDESRLLFSWDEFWKHREQACFDNDWSVWIDTRTDDEILEAMDAHNCWAVTHVDDSNNLRCSNCDRILRGADSEFRYRN